MDIFVCDDISRSSSSSPSQLLILSSKVEETTFLEVPLEVEQSAYLNASIWNCSCGASPWNTCKYNRKKVVVSFFCCSLSSTSSAVRCGVAKCRSCAICAAAILSTSQRGEFIIISEEVEEEEKEEEESQLICGDFSSYSCRFSTV